MSCVQCEMLMINGVACHEAGCPDRWKQVTGCAFCGGCFLPERRFQVCCGHSCDVAYNGDTCGCTECENDFGYLNNTDETA